MFINFIFPLTNDRARFASPVDSAQATCYQQNGVRNLPCFQYCCDINIAIQFEGSTLSKHEHGWDV